MSKTLSVNKVTIIAHFNSIDLGIIQPWILFTHTNVLLPLLTFELSLLPPMTLSHANL